MVNTIQGHPLFTIEDVQKKIDIYKTPLDPTNPCSVSYDEYDLDNLAYSAQFLINSIDVKI
jgi:hypothetical protein